MFCWNIATDKGDYWKCEIISFIVFCFKIFSIVDLKVKVRVKRRFSNGSILYFKFISIDEMQVIVEWNIIYIAEAGFNGVWLTFHIYS
jgi:hypothetical protein